MPPQEWGGFCQQQTIMTTKIYIAGMITGLPLEPCKYKFEQAEQHLRLLGANPINPLKLGIPEHFTFAESKPHNFKALRQCHAIFMLKCWNDSRGAREELKEAMRLNLVVFFESAGDYNIVGNLVAEQITA